MAGRQVKKILFELSTGKSYLVKDLDADFHTPSGTIKKTDLQSGQSKVTSNKKISFSLLEPGFADLWGSLQRGPQIVLQKDIGLILAKTGINQESRVVDAGGGSGSLCFSLANVCKEITTYEINPEHYRILVKNAALLGIKNLTIKQENVYHGITEKELDLITLDLPEPWLALETAEKALKPGGFLVVYLPNLLQAKQFLDAAKGTSIKNLDTIELLERKWKIEDKIMRPEFEMLGHTGFLTFCRKL